MRRTSISIPDDLRRQAKEAGLNIMESAWAPRKLDESVDEGS
jgi:hypothetical protein